MIRLPPITALFPYTTLFRSITIHKPVLPHHDRAAAIGHRRMQDRPRVHERVELAVLAAGVDPGWEVAQQRERRVPHVRSEEHTSEIQSRPHLVCRILLGQKS